jgi:hypothetical protein
VAARQGLVLLAALASISPAPAKTAAAAAPALTAEARQALTERVRAFALKVARDVTRDGPGAWSRYFQNSPDFFMAVNGQLAFADGEAASRGIAALPALIKHIKLTWGEDLRIDPLTAGFAVVAASYTEIQEDPAGRRHTDRGFFSAVAELSDGHWVFRDAHWSSVPASPAK